MLALTSWSLPSVSLCLAAGLPALLSLGALSLTLPAPPERSGAPLDRAFWLTALGLLLALSVQGLAPWSRPSAPAAPPIVGLRLDVVGRAMLLLVAGLGWAVAGYSRSLLSGQRQQRRYARALLTTLAAVALLVLASDLRLLWLSWVVTSLSLHQLLTFFADRPAALLAAHKKFLVSRLAELCLLAAIALIGTTVGSFDLQAVAVWVGRQPRLPLTLQIAALLLVGGAALKSAQLPFHGWLLQVMEAPTPVSALLHAGVVNLGGFLMIRLAPLLAGAPLAQTLLVAWGATTAVIAALVLSTRVSVKVALAWSTCAQMGVMLVECGLGAWNLAFLHLLAHALYKAYAFLDAGGAVDRYRQKALGRGPPALWRGAALLALLGVAFALSHLAVGDLVPVATNPALANLRWSLVAAGAVLLLAFQLLLAVGAETRLAQGLHRRLFAGFYLDERFTRATFRLWPPRRPRPAEPAAGPLGQLPIALTPAALDLGLDARGVGR